MKLEFVRMGRKIIKKNKKRFACVKIYLYLCPRVVAKL